MKPNIVIILSDALRAKDLSIYGYPKENDPNIKRIANESLVFEKNFSASNASDPSITSIFSAKYPMNHGFIHQHPFIREEEINKLRKNTFWLPIYLKGKGYTTISATPLYMWFKKGFDINKEKQVAAGGKFFDKPAIKRILLNLPNWAYRLGKKLVKIRTSPHFFSAKQAVDFAIESLNSNKEPFFLFMHFVDTHYPYPIAKKQNIHGRGTIKEILSRIKSPAQKEYIKKRFFDINAESIEEIEKRRDYSIRAVDSEIGRFYNFLKQTGLWKNTVFIIMSDHGDNFGEHETYFCRGGLYDSSVHVPLIMHIPGLKSKRISELTQSVDIAPTIVEILGDSKKGFDGKSLIALAKKNIPARKYAFSSDGFSEDRISVRTMRRKFIKSSQEKCYLCGASHGSKKEEYNLENDSEEKVNIYLKKDELEKQLDFI